MQRVSLLPTTNVVQYTPAGVSLGLLVYTRQTKTKAASHCLHLQGLVASFFPLLPFSPSGDVFRLFLAFPLLSSISSHLISADLSFLFIS